MQCFAHEEAAAVAVCRTCGRGLCRECTNEAVYGVTCGGPCADYAARAHILLEKSHAALNDARKQLVSTCHFLLVVGLALGGYGFLDGLRIAQIMGVLFLACAVVGYFYLASQREEDGTPS